MTAAARRIAACIFLLAILCLLPVSCGDDKNTAASDSLVIASWNVQNLFNGKADGNEYSQYKPSGGWSEKQYKVRLKNTAAVLEYEGIGRAGVIILNEVENESVVEDILSESTLKKRGFRFYAAAGELDGAIKTAVISSLEILEARVHAVEGARPVLEVRLDAGGRNLFILAVHAKSNLGDSEENTALRAALGRTVRQISLRIKEENPECIVVLAGDFNEEAEDGNVIAQPDAWCWFWEKGFALDPYGSYNYKGRWYRYDNIALSADIIKAAGVVAEGMLLTADGLPNAYNRNLFSGVSDHLPVWVEISLR